MNKQKWKTRAGQTAQSRRVSTHTLLVRAWSTSTSERTTDHSLICDGGLCRESQMARYCIAYCLTRLYAMQHGFLALAWPNMTQRPSVGAVSHGVSQLMSDRDPILMARGFGRTNHGRWLTEILKLCLYFSPHTCSRDILLHMLTHIRHIKTAPRIQTRQ